MNEATRPHQSFLPAVEPRETKYCPFLFKFSLFPPCHLILFHLTGESRSLDCGKQSQFTRKLCISSSNNIMIHVLQCNWCGGKTHILLSPSLAGKPAVMQLRFILESLVTKEISLNVLLNILDSLTYHFSFNTCIISLSYTARWHFCELKDRKWDQFKLKLSWWARMCVCVCVSTTLLFHFIELVPNGVFASSLILVFPHCWTALHNRLSSFSDKDWGLRKALNVGVHFWPNAVEWIMCLDLCVYLSVARGWALWSQRGKIGSDRMRKEQAD